MIYKEGVESIMIYKEGVEMKKIAFLCLFTGILMFSAQGVLPQQAQDMEWEIQLQMGGNGEVTPDSQTITMKKGREFSIVITPDSDSFCYVLSKNQNQKSKQKFAVLHNQRVGGGKEIILKPLQADNSPGKKTLYVIVSVERQTNLEELIKAYIKKPASSENTNKLQDEIAGLQDRVSDLGQPASVIISTGGSTRGDIPVAGDYVTRFSGKNTYIRAFTINAASANP
jgi:hypothetical protein